MSVAQVAFDTLAYANRLKKAGVDPKIAEVQAELQVQVLNDLTENRLATKKDMESLRLATKEDMEELRKATKEDMGELRKDMDLLRLATKEDMGELRKDMDLLRLATKEDMKKLRVEIDSKFEKFKNELLIKLGAMVVGCSVILGALSTVLAHV